MSLEQPERLLLAYTQVMMTALLFEPNPRSALVLGLGGGSMARFLRHHFPDCETTAVEVSEAVADIARRYFLVPPDSDGFRLVLGDAARYVAECDRRFDLILVDVFESDRTIDVFASSEFFDACRRLLSPGGVASVNVLVDGELEGLSLSKRFRRSFRGAVSRCGCRSGPTWCCWEWRAIPGKSICGICAAARPRWARDWILICRHAWTICSPSTHGTRRFGPGGQVGRRTVRAFVTQLTTPGQTLG